MCEKEPDKTKIIDSIINDRYCGDDIECMICPYWDKKNGTCKLIFAGAIYIKQIFGSK